MIGRITRRLSTEGPDAGVYAILYGIVLLVFIAFTALVVDIGSLQEDRRTDRALTDNAAIAGATALGQDPPDANAACRAAWSALRVNLGAPKDDAADKAACAPFPLVTSKSFVSCPASPITAAGTLTFGGVTYRVDVTWPVTDDSDLMTSPDVHPAFTSISQTTVVQDGNACARVGVTVGHDRQLLFAGALGYNASSTLDHSVALSNVSPGPSKEAAPLVVLDPHMCNTLTAEGGGGVLVSSNDTTDPPTPGIIAVDSDGSDCLGLSTVVDSNSSSSILCTPLTYAFGHCPSSIWAQDSSDGQRARINLYALKSGTPAPGYKPSEVTCTTSALPNGPNGALCPKPTTLLARVGRNFIDENYNCTVVSDCDPTGPNAGISRLSDFVKTNFAMTGSCANDSFPSNFTCIGPNKTCTWSGSVKSCTASTTGDQCKSAAPGVYKGVNIFIDCVSSAFSVKGGTTVAFPVVSGTNSTIVFAGDVSVSGSGSCLAFNDDGSMCSSPSLADEPTDGPVVYVGGQLSTSSGGTFVAPQTFVLLGSCSRDGTTCTTKPSNVSFQDNSAGSILWSAPMGPLLSVPTACTSGVSPPPAACFAKMALWSEYSTPTSNPDDFFGQAGLLLRGSFFTPNAQFNISGGSGANIKDAQFITGRLDVNGGALLTMVPNLKYTNPPPILAAVLIR